MSYALHEAAERGYMERMILLTKYEGYDVNDRYSDYTPLHCAARGGHVKSIMYLVENGAEIDPCDNWKKETPLHLAAQYGNVEAVKLLLSLGANKSLRDCYRKRPKERASVEEIKLILSRKDDELLNQLPTEDLQEELVSARVVASPIQVRLVDVKFKLTIRNEIYRKFSSECVITGTKLCTSVARIVPDSYELDNLFILEKGLCSLFHMHMWTIQRDEQRKRLIVILGEKMKNDPAWHTRRERYLHRLELAWFDDVLAQELFEGLSKEKLEYHFKTFSDINGIPNS